MADQTTTTQPIILSIDVDDDSSYPSEYRLQIGNRIKYLVIEPGTFDKSTLLSPLQSLPYLPDNDEWTVAYISRDEPSGSLKSLFSNLELAAIQNRWHHNVVDCLHLKPTKQLTGMAFEATLGSELLVAKIARFEWELTRIEQETRAYQLLEGSGLSPRFLGHVHESGRIMGFILEKLEGRSASIEDLEICEAALRKLHSVGLGLGDVNGDNFLVMRDGGVKLLDLENLTENASAEMMQKELENLRFELTS